MKKIIFYLFALVCYTVFFATFLYMVGFVENVTQFEFAKDYAALFPKSVDFGESSVGIFPAILINLGLIALFGIQHSIMARASFKEKWTKIVPKPIERSTYVLFSSIVLIILFYFWQPVTIGAWDFSDSVVGSIFLFLSLTGWSIVLISTFIINHFDLFGLRQVYLHSKNNVAYQRPVFRTPNMYRMVRHPLYFGFLLAFWFAPIMTVGHIVFSLGMTVYIFVGITHEEKDLVKDFGDKYTYYRQRVPKIIPFLKKRSGSS